MCKLKLIMSTMFIVGVVVLMVAPIGVESINDTYVVGFKLDYVIHCLIYLPWMFTVKILFTKKFRPFLWLTCGIIFSMALEFIQYILPYRSFNINDQIAGIIGVILSYVLFRLAHKLKCYKLIKP